MKLNLTLYWIILGMISVNIKYCIAVGDDAEGENPPDAQNAEGENPPDAQNEGENPPEAQNAEGENPPDAQNGEGENPPEAQNEGENPPDGQAAGVNNPQHAGQAAGANNPPDAGQAAGVNNPQQVGQAAGANNPQQVGQGVGGNNPPDAGQGPHSQMDAEERRRRGLKGSDLIKVGCIFNERDDLGIEPFSKTKKDDESCEIKVKSETDAFMYACDGASDPVQCPMEVKVDEDVVKLDTLFTQATITNQSANHRGMPSIYHVVTGKAQKEFVASCECTRADGKKDIMKIISSFEQVRILGVVGVFILLLIK